MNKAYIIENEIMELKKEFERYEIEKWYSDREPGEKKNLQKMIEDINPGDLVYTYDFTQIAKSIQDLSRVVNEIIKRGGNIISLYEKFNTTDQRSSVQLQSIYILAEFQTRANNRRRKHGIENARKENKYTGRKPIIIDEEQLLKLKKMLAEKKITKNKLSSELGISRPTLNKLLSRTT